ncbi:hypothetical protein LTR06_011245 [Exophiala xenobiotica]|nr:hypothetical protein LTR06_011245 [Exophiala xenobiotica]
MLRHGQVSIRAFCTDISMYAVFFPATSMGTLHPLWVHTGTGVSSRFAEHCLETRSMLLETTIDAPALLPKGNSAHRQLKERIVDLLRRAPVNQHRSATVSPDDVYPFQTGMSAIYWVHKYPLSKHKSLSVLFGFAFHSTIHALQDFGGPGSEFFGLGTPEDLRNLENYLTPQAKQGIKVQAIWAEFPSNPLLVTPDLLALRKLANKYGALLIVDDTIASFSNVDVLGVADLVVTSLTKSFSGYADVMAASAALKPSSARYDELAELFNALYRNDFFVGDAEALEENSRDYLQRSAILNNNAEQLIRYLQGETGDPTSPVKQVYYPSISESVANYRAFMRPETADLTPGYGCLFSVELDSIEAAIAFYDNLNVHQGPHLGAHLTLAIGYCMGVYGNELEWAAKYGLGPTQIRVSVGLEATASLLQVFTEVVKAAKTCALVGASVADGLLVDGA